MSRRELHRECLSDSELTAYLESHLEAEARAEAENHLSECSECRGRLVAAFDREPEAIAEIEARVPENVLETVRQAPFEDRSSFDVRWVARAAVFAVLVFGLALGLRLTDGPDQGSPGPAVRSGTDLSGPLQLELPKSVSSDELTFRWRSLEPADRFTVSVTDPAGDLVLRETVAEPRWTPDPGTLTAPGSYFWYVTAHLKNGEVVESEIREMELVVGSGNGKSGP